MRRFWNGSLLFNTQYLRQFFIKTSNQGKFWNQLVLRIPKLPLVVRFDKDSAEILRVKEKASISKSSRFFQVRVYMRSHCGTSWTLGIFYPNLPLELVSIFVFENLPITCQNYENFIVHPIPVVYKGEFWVMVPHRWTHPQKDNAKL